MNLDLSPVVVRASRIEQLMAGRDMTAKQIMTTMGMSSPSMVNESLRVLRGIHPKYPSEKRIFIPYWLPPPSKRGQWIAVWRLGNEPDVLQPSVANRKAILQSDLPHDFGRPKPPPLLPIDSPLLSAASNRRAPRSKQPLPPPSRPFRDPLTSALFGAVHKKAG